MRTRSVLPPLLTLGLVFGWVLAAAAWAGVTTVQALPEYTRRTGEPCVTCHVSAGGGGPRTLRGLLWGARGRPDRVPTLPGLLIAPGVTEEAELYDIACAGCHGRTAEGLFGTSLTGTQVGRASIRSFIVRGLLPLGMPAFQGQFTNSQLDTLVIYVAQLASGEVLPPADTVRLPPARFKCVTTADFGCESPRPADGEGN